MQNTKNAFFNAFLGSIWHFLEIQQAWIAQLVAKTLNTKEIFYGCSILWKVFVDIFL
jgi:hypothetical protein